MRSASAYTNKTRVEGIARNTKVEYPGKVAKNIEVLGPACATTPNFTTLEYIKSHNYCGLKTHGCTK